MVPAKPPATRTARERAREEVTAEILAEARRQLAVDGPSGLSLRSVARELGMVSSAVYRYVESRDDLLTRLIVEAYDSLGASAERAAARSRGEEPADRFCAVARSIRSWARRHPHEYALVYGTPIPGYAAPTDTIAPAERVSRALAGVVVDAARSGSLAPPPGPSTPVTDAVRADLSAVADALAPDDDLDLDLDLDLEVVVRLIAAWTQLFGLVSFELFGQTTGLITAHGDLFDATTRSMAAHLGLPGGLPG